MTDVAGRVCVAAEAAFWAIVVEAGLRAVGVRRLIAMLARLPRTSSEPSIARIEQICRISAGVSTRLFSSAACLRSGLATYAMLRRRRVAVSLVIGARRAGDAFAAHAWLEHRGQVMGGSGGERGFVPIWTVPAEGSSEGDA